MEGMLEVDVLIYPNEIRIASPEGIREWELETASQLSLPTATARLFVALYPYNPASMSPNKETAGEELPFVPGQIIKVLGDKDPDGFYHGESGGLSGYVPGNMVAEVPVDDDHVKHLLMQQGFLPVDHTGITIVPDSGDSIPDDVVVRRMVAIFEYDPWENSPNTDSEDELGFRAGDIIYVFGDMDQDGFYYVSGYYPLVFTESQNPDIVDKRNTPSSPKETFMDGEAWCHQTTCNHCHGIRITKKLSKKHANTQMQ